MNTPGSRPLAADDRMADELPHKRVAQLPLSPALPCVRSEDLFGLDREIMIQHAGAQYRLRLTRANKLILTK